MKHKWSQSSLFPEEASATVDIRISLNQEASVLGIAAAVTIGKRLSPESEIVAWNNYNANGLALALESVVELIQETEQHHGLEVDALVIERNAAPF